MLTFKSSFLISQIATAMVAVIENGASFDVETWPPQEDEHGTFSCDALIDCKVRLKGFEESHGVDRVTVRFDSVFHNCTFNEKETVFESDLSSVSVWGGGCSYNLVFENSEGGKLHTCGIGGFLEKFDEQDDETITENLINTVMRQLNPEIKKQYLKDVFFEYNKAYKEAVRQQLERDKANEQAA